MDSAKPFTPLNWKELELLTASLNQALAGHFVDRVVVPARARFPEGFVRGEWAIRLTSRDGERSLIFSIRARNPYLFVTDDKGPRAAENATHSPFSLGLSRQLRGAKCVGIEALPRERIVILWFTAPE